MTNIEKMKSGQADIDSIRNILSDRKKFMIRMLDAGCSFRAIGRTFLISPVRVRQIIGPRQIDELASQELVDDILDDYKNDGMTLPEIGEAYGISSGVVKKIIDKNLSLDDRKKMKRERFVNRVRHSFSGFVSYLGERRVCNPNDILRYDRALYASIHRMRGDERRNLFLEFGIELKPLRSTANLHRWNEYGQGKKEK